MAKRSQSKRCLVQRGRPLDIELLRDFEIVYRVGNYTKMEAMFPGGGQPRWTKRIQALEAYFGGEKLFKRAGAGVIPTPLADRLVEPIRQLIEHFDKVVSNTFQFDPARSEQTFGLHVRPDIAPFLVPPLVKRIAVTAPNVRLYMKARRDKLLASDLRSGDPEIAIYTEIVKDKACRHEALFEDRIAVIARKDHPRIKGNLTRELYSELEHIIVARTGPDDLSPFEIECRKHNIFRDVRLATPVPAIVPEIVLTTDLIATTSRRMASRFRQQFDVAVYDMPLRDIKLTYYMMWHDNFDDDPSHVWLRGVIKDVARELAAGDRG